MSGDRRDEALALLEKGMAIVDDDEKLRLSLAELLTQRGIERGNAAVAAFQSSAERGKPPTKKSVRQLKQGVADLERATELGSERAREQAALARQALEQVEHGMLGVPPQIADLLTAASDAAQREDWDTAVDRLRKAIAATGEEPPEGLKSNLAVCLANRAQKRAGTAVEAANRAAAEQQQQVEQLLDMWMTGGSSLDLPKASRATRGPKKPWWKLEKGWWRIGWSGVFYLGGAAAIWVVAGLTKNSDLFALGLMWLLFIAPLLFTIGGWIQKQWSDINALGNAVRYPSSGYTTSGLSCFKCGAPAVSEVNLGPGGPKPLCASHTGELRGFLDSAQHPLPPPGAVASFVAAEADLAEAAKLDPKLPGVSENLRQVREMISSFGSHS